MPSFPAARVGDMHTCPMVTPGVPPVPHVGGPIMPPGVLTVLVANQPAACMFDMATCVGPPDSITQGCFTVLIGGKPAASVSHMTAHGGIIVAGMPTVLYGGTTISSSNPMASDLAILNLVSNSPTLMGKMDSLLQEGWIIRFGDAGDGSYCDREKKEIVVDLDEDGDSLMVTQTLAHEAGHATYEPDPYVEPDGLTKKQYVDANVNNDLKDEGEATITNVEVRDEIQENTGEDIGIAGSQTSDYEKITKDYQDGNIDRDTARQQIGDKFADGESPSGEDPNTTYRDYYSEPYEEFYDDNVGP